MMEEAASNVDVGAAELNPTHYCTFCGNGNTEVEFILAGDAGCICDECVDICSYVINQNRKKRREAVAVE